MNFFNLHQTKISSLALTTRVATSTFKSQTRYFRKYNSFNYSTFNAVNPRRPITTFEFYLISLSHLVCFVIILPVYPLSPRSPFAIHLKQKFLQFLQYYFIGAQFTLAPLVRLAQLIPCHRLDPLSRQSRRHQGNRDLLLTLQPQIRFSVYNKIFS